MPKKVDLSRSELEDLYAAQGKSLGEIASALGCSKATVANYVRRYGIASARRPGRKPSPIPEQELRDAYVLGGRRLEELAGMFSCSVSTISARIREWSLREERDAVLNVRIGQMLSDGASRSEAARKLGIGRDQVARRANAMGMSPLGDGRKEPVTDGTVVTSTNPARHVTEANGGEGKVIGKSAVARPVSDDDAWHAWVESLGVRCDMNARPAWGADPVALYLPEFRLGIDIARTSERSIDVVTETGRTHASHVTQRYHQRQSKMAESAGGRIIRIYDWDDESRIRDVIRSAVGLGERIHARKTKVIPVARRDEAAFLEANHLQGYVRSSFCYGLVDETGRLVSVMSFCPPRYGNKDDAEWELLRLCSLTSVMVPGGASRLFTHFAREHRPHKVMSYCNYDISVGGVYEAMGFSFERLTSPSYTWARKDDPSEHYSWSVVNSVGYDRLFGTSYGKGTSNSELMLEHGFVRVYNAGNKVYVWTDGQWR